LNSNDNEFWKSIGKIGIANDHKMSIPLQVMLDNGDITGDLKTVLNKWKTDFSSLYNANSTVYNTDFRCNENVTDSLLDNDLCILEVKRYRQGKIKKASGFDHIPSDVLIK
jgi:hypothetical protein